MGPPAPPEEIAHLMRFIAEKAKNVTSPMNVQELCRQFKAVKGCSLSMKCLEARIRLHRHRIHDMNEFDIKTKVKMIFALGATIDARFLIEMKKVADVDVDGQQRIIQYKQKDGGLELSAKYIHHSTSQGEQRDRSIIQFLAKQSETTDTPIPDEHFLRKFKESSRCTDSLESLRMRYRRVKETIYQSTEIDKNTKIKMMFLSNVKLSVEVLKELRKNAVVEVDKKERIIKYKGNDGRLELEGRHRLSSRQRHFEEKRLNLCAASWSEICEKINKDESEEDERDVSNWQKDYDKKRIDLVQFLIERTKNATFPLKIDQLAADFKTEFDSSESQKSTLYRIESFRSWIHEINQFDMSTKVKMMFALSAPVDTKFLEVIQKYAFVELDEMRRIKTYISNDGSLELEIDHSFSANIQVGKVNASSGSTGEKYSQSTRMSQNVAAIQKWRKRARQVSEDEESLKLEGDSAVACDTTDPEDFHYNPPSYELDMEHIPTETKPETLIEVKTEVPEGPSTSYSEYRYEENLFDYDPSTYEKDLEHFPEEKKPENYIEVKLEVSEESSTNNLEYHCEENLDHILIEPKPEVG